MFVVVEKIFKVLDIGQDFMSVLPQYNTLKQQLISVGLEYSDADGREYGRNFMISSNAVIVAVTRALNCKVWA